MRKLFLTVWTILSIILNIYFKVMNLFRLCMDCFFTALINQRYYQTLNIVSRSSSFSFIWIRNLKPMITSRVITQGIGTVSSLTSIILDTSVKLVSGNATSSGTNSIAGLSISTSSEWWFLRKSRIQHPKTMCPWSTLLVKVSCLRINMLSSRLSFCLRQLKI